MPDNNLALLKEAARLLKTLLRELVFVGGSTTSLLVTDKAAAEVRPTYDVDAIAEITSYAAYADFSQRLRLCWKESNFQHSDLTSTTKRKAFQRFPAPSPRLKPCWP
jgi:hypothetical protein